MPEPENTDLENQENEGAENEGAENENENQEWTPPTKEEWEKSQKELKRATDQAVKARQRLKETPQAPAADEVEEAKRQGTAEAETKWKSRTVAAEARAELSKMGLVGDPAKIVKMLDLDSIDVEDDGTVIGLSTQLDELKTDLPALFTKTKGDPRSAKDAAERPPAKKELTDLDIIAAAMRG